MDDFPSNSYNKVSKQPEKVKENAEPKPEVEKVISGEVVRRKKPLGKRVAETFGGDDMKSVWSYVVMEVMIPAAKDMIVDATSQGIERMIFGEVRARGSRPSSRGSNYTPYNRYSSNVRKEEPSRSISPRGRSAHNFDEIVLPTRVEAEEVIERLYDLVSKYDIATVADLYSLVGIKPQYTDEKWGWTDLRGLGATRIRNGYLIDIPRPEPID